MANTTTALVQQRLGDNYDWEVKPSLDAEVATSVAMVNQVALEAGRLGRPVPTGDVVELIQRNLAAHFYCVKDALYMSKSTEGASGSFQRKTGDGFDATEYGRTACQLDFSGVLTAYGKRQVARAMWLGSRCNAGPWWGWQAAWTGNCNPPNNQGF